MDDDALGLMQNLISLVTPDEMVSEIKEAAQELGERSATVEFNSTIVRRLVIAGFRTHCTSLTLAQLRFVVESTLAPQVNECGCAMCSGMLRVALAELAARDTGDPH
jgi:hypothetical protein